MRLPNPEAYELIGFEVNKGKKSKYDAILKNKKTGEKKRVSFGGKYPDGTPYEQYHDKIGYYSKYDHNDKERRRLYLLRHKNDLGFKFSSAYFSTNFLW
jgi:hypothetical protein